MKVIYQKICYILITYQSIITFFLIKEYTNKFNEYLNIYKVYLSFDNCLNNTKQIPYVP